MVLTGFKYYFVFEYANIQLQPYYLPTKT